MRCERDDRPLPFETRTSEHHPTGQRRRHVNTSEPSIPWHCLTAESAASKLGTQDLDRGLDRPRADERLQRFGLNQLEVEEGRGVAAIALAQFRDFMILVLLAAAVVSGLLGERSDALAIVVIVVLNAAVGAVQEYRAQRAISALRRMSALEARVLRSGKVQRIPASGLVPGDVVQLAAGEVVPADLRLVTTDGLMIDESSLTGESLPVEKKSAPLDDAELGLSDCTNLAYRSTAVTRGQATGLVVATGLDTAIGQVAQRIAKGSTYRTPLQQRLARFGRRLAVAVLMICAAIFVLGLAQGHAPLTMFLTAVSLAVAAIPEALPAVLTAALALGARKLSRCKTLVRRLPAVETLGSVTFICADKTGTLTENRMRLDAIVAAGDHYPALAQMPDTLRVPLGRALALCHEVGERTDAADPTEVALVEAAAEAGFERSTLIDELSELARIAFDSDRRRMTTLHRQAAGATAFLKGAPEEIFGRCRDALDAEGQSAALDAQGFEAATAELATTGHRVLAVAMKHFDRPPEDTTETELERDLTLIALVGLSDPIREAVPAAIAECRSAGIEPLMITGDHPDTARYIGIELGLPARPEATITGAELRELSDEALTRRLDQVRIFARMDPTQKIRIVEALQAKGEFVAMTGDGVNDAPALKQASIGVAMGERGTDVAREAADMVLLDDNFATIVTAVREGRRVYDNIRKFIRYTLTSNAGEIWVLLVAPLIGLPIPLLPIQILWVNLVTDGLPGLAFSGERAEPDVMRRPPRPPRESVFAHGMWQHIVAVGVVIAGVSLATALFTDPGNEAYWRTMVFTTLVMAQLAQALAVRSEHASLFSLGPFSNRFLLAAVGVTLLVQTLAIYLPAGNEVLHTIPIGALDFALCLLLGALVLPVVELLKCIERIHRGKRR